MTTLASPSWGASRETRLGANTGAAPLLPLSEVRQLWGRTEIQLHGRERDGLELRLETKCRALQGEEREGHK